MAASSLALLLYEVGCFGEDSGALLDVSFGPLGERALGRRHRELDVLGRAGGHAVDDLLGGRVDHLEPFLVRGGFAPLTSDQHLGHAVAPLRKRVRPRRSERGWFSSIARETPGSGRRRGCPGQRRARELFLDLCGDPAARTPGGISCALGTTAPAATIAPAPTWACWSTIAPMPMSASRRSRSPRASPRVRSTTSAPITVGRSVAQWITALSWIELPAPISMCETSPRSTVPNQMFARSPTRTSPTRTAVVARKTSSPMVGATPSSSTIVAT